MLNMRITTSYTSSLLVVLLSRTTFIEPLFGQPRSGRILVKTL